MNNLIDAILQKIYVNDVLLINYNYFYNNLSNDLEKFINYVIEIHKINGMAINDIIYVFGFNIRKRKIHSQNELEINQDLYTNTINTYLNIVSILLKPIRINLSYNSDNNDNTNYIVYDCYYDDFIDYHYKILESLISEYINEII
jgi:hypothetical protein